MTVNVEVAEPPEQLPSDCDPETVIGCGQSTVSLADKVVGVNPVQSPYVSEEVNLQIIALPCGTFTLNEPTPQRDVQFEPPSNEYSTLI